MNYLSNGLQLAPGNRLLEEIDLYDARMADLVRMITLVRLHRALSHKSHTDCTAGRRGSHTINHSTFIVLQFEDIRFVELVPDA